MKKQQKPHPVDLYEVDVIEKAAYFRAMKFEGRGHRYFIENLTREQAYKLFREEGKVWMVYAVMSTGRYAMLTEKNMRILVDKQKN
jgi:hypothetical protein